MKARFLAGVVVVVVFALGTALQASASDFSQGKGAKAAANWAVYNYNASGQAYYSRVATTSDQGIGFDFLNTMDTALFLTKHDKSLLGDLTGKTVTATFEIAGDPGTTFSYYGAPDACGTPASARLYFAGNTGGKFTYDSAGYSKYWWSNPIASQLQTTFDGGVAVTLTVPVTTGNWSNWGGQLGVTVPTYFAAAAQDVSSIGLSFGGGCFFANGVGVTAGNASFVLSSFTVS